MYILINKYLTRMNINFYMLLEEEDMGEFGRWNVLKQKKYLQ